MRTQSGRYAALVDIENTLIVRGRRVTRTDAHALFGEIDRHVVGMPVHLASGRHILCEYMSELATRGWGRRLVPTLPDAADAVLLAAGAEFAAAGVADLLVVGGDHAYVELASLARLHVVAHRGQLSRALKLSATTVTYLSHISGLVAA